MATPKMRIEAFNPSKISLEFWLSLLDANFAHLGITEDEKKKNFLLVSVGIDVFAVLGNVCAPDLPHTKTFSDLVSLLKAHYIVKPSYHRSLLAFQQRKKKTEESLNTLYAELKALAKDCSFGDQFDPRVRDQLFMAVEQEVYFPNLVAENLDLQKMTSAKILDRILNLEKAFVGEKKVDDCSQIKKVNGVSKNLACRHCGFPHDSWKCRFKNFTCNNCNVKGHLKKVCPEAVHEAQSFNKSKRSMVDKHRPNSSKGKDNRKTYGKSYVNAVEDSETSSDDGEDRLLTVKEKVHAISSEEFDFMINKNVVPFEIDSGAAVSTLAKDWVEPLNMKVESCTKKLSAYDNIKINVLGKVIADVEYNGINVSHAFYVVDSKNSNLCGKDLMSKVGIYLAGVDKMTKVNKIDAAEGLLDKYKVDFSKPISSVVAKIHVRCDVSPIFRKARTVPFYHKPMVEAALDKLVNDGIIEPVSHSEWAAPIVPVLKPDKVSIRICADFKELNKQIQCDQYPLPKIDELLSSVGKGKVFSKIDLQNAYLQIPVDEGSQECLVINTHKGMFKYKRLPFGLSSSPAIFQRFISQLLAGIEGVSVYLDDILVSGDIKAEHDERLRQVLHILQEHNVQINKKKSVLNTSSIEYLGYHISGQGIKPSPRKLTAILEAPCPKSIAEVQSFLGMVTYYCKFVKNFSTKLSPLYDLLKKGATFRWTKVEQNAFQGIKTDLCEGKLLTNFNGDYPLILEVDASPVGVGCVLLQKVNDQELPIYFASKKLSSAEQNYSQIDKEGLALVFGMHRFRYFLLGRKFVARTDHKPLLGLFGKGRHVPSNANARIQRWALLMSQYDYDLVHKSGRDNVIADALSRLPINDEFESGIPAEYVKLVEALDFDDLSFQTIRRVTRKDAMLRQLLNCLKFGWNDKHVELVEYSSVKSDLSLHNNVILFRNRVLIPVELRCKVLEHLHSGHNGINAMKAEARNWVWWPKIDQDIAEITKNCHICFKNFQKPQAQVLSWSCSGKPWSRLHIDYAGPVDDKYFLVIVDSYTKFMDVHTTSSMTSSVTIELLRKSFCNFGLPDVIVSDNAPYFVSQEMEAFLKKNGIHHITPAPYNPSSNGLAERGVRTLKEGLTRFMKGSLNTRICRFLYNQRKTVHSSTGKTPSELMFNRNFRVTVESVKQECQNKRELVKLGDKLFQDTDKSFKVGDAVYVRNYGRGVPWVGGKIVEVIGVRNYKVQVQSFGNIIWKRHADQVMPRFTGEFDQKENTDSPQCTVTRQMHNSVLSPNLEKLCDDVTTGVHEDEIANESDPVEVFSSSKDPETQVMGSSQVIQTPRRSGRTVKPPDRLNL